MLRHKCLSAGFWIFSAVTALLAGDTVVLYEYPDYEGRSIVIDGDIADVCDIPPGDFGVTSVRIPEGYEVILFEDSAYRGRSVMLREDEPDVGNTYLGSTVVSSIQVNPPREEEHEPPQHFEGVTLFSEPDFSGDFEVFPEGEPDLSKSFIGNDRACSVYVPPGTTVVLFEHRGFGGRSITLTRDESDLGLTELGCASVSSIHIINGPDRRHVNATPPPQEPYVEPEPFPIDVGVFVETDDFGEAVAVLAGAAIISGIVHEVRRTRARNIARPKIMIYDQENFQGRKQSLRKNIRKMRKTFLGNDALSSIEIPPGYQVVLYEHERYRGRSIILRESIANLDMTDFGNRQASSMRIQWVGP